MRLYTSNTRENEYNTLYNRRAEIANEEDLARAVRLDHIAGQMKNDRRSVDNFISADCLMLDLDNTHSEEPDDWQHLEDVMDAFPDVDFYAVPSRNHMKDKRKKNKKTGEEYILQARPKYHLYFPLAKEVNGAEYENLIFRVLGLFPYFDASAIDNAHFFFGVADPQPAYLRGNLTIDDYMATVAEADIQRSITKYAQERGDAPDKATSRLYDHFHIKSNSTPQAATDAPSAEGLDWITEQETAKSVKWLEEWAANHGVELGTRYRVPASAAHPNATAICVTCPWEDEHSEDTGEKQTVIMIDAGGKLDFKCRHNHNGRAITWKQYRDKIEYGDPEKWENAAAALRERAAKRAESQPDPEEPLPGLLTYDRAVSFFETADDRILDLKSFPTFGATAKIKLHDSFVLAADTGAGKSSLAINFMNDLNGAYPCIYFNLEMDNIDVLRRLTAIQSGIELDTIEGYRRDAKTAEAVNTSLKAITSRKPLQVIQGAYLLPEIEDIIKQSTAGREDTTIVFIDHSLLVDTKKSTASRYDRFTQVSEGLRKMALTYNIILFVLLQQSRAGKAEEAEPPRNSSLKESGSWENDATQICFLWYDPTIKRKKLLLTKNRHGNPGEFILNYWKKTQTYAEAKAGGQASADPAPRKLSKRDKQQQKLEDAYRAAYTATGGQPTIKAMAEAADVTTSTIKSWIKEYGGCMVDGVSIDPAGLNTEVEYTGFIKLTPADEDPFKDAGASETPAKKKTRL